MSKILLIGDSYTAHMPTNLIGTEEDEVINVGIENIGISSCQQLVWSKVCNNNFDTIVLSIGINNILRPNCDSDDLETLEEIIEKMISFINQINRNDAKIIVQSVYPTRDLELNQKIQKFNDKISEHCYYITIEYLDLYELLTDNNGLLREEYTQDGINPNMNAYNLIANQINELFLMYDNKYFK